MDFLDELANRIIPGDGAMGTLLMEAGVPLERCFEELCISQPDQIRHVHEQYLAAGARVIETNSFGANAVRLEKYGLADRVREINASAVKLAQECVAGRDAYVAASVGPLGIGADEARVQGIDRRAVFQEQVSALLDAGAQLVIFETFFDFEELTLALEVKRELDGCPVICSLACNDEGRLPSGMNVVEAFADLRRRGADVVGLNCVNGPQAMLRLFERLPLDGPLSAFPNAGHPKYHDGRYLYYTEPDYFAQVARKLVEQGARLIGGCCGFGPAHIAAMAKALEGLTPARSKTVVVSEPVPPKQSSTPAQEETSILDLVKAGKTVIVTELDPPKTLDLEKYFAGAKALTEAGSDAITLADNSLAILRVSNLAIGAMLKERFGITPLLHISCRDKNLLGLQSELMGMAALGMRHVLPLTGDPAKVGDHPGAQSVYDINSVELMKLITRMNEGYNYNGKSIKYPTRFVTGCTFNPNVKNLDAQVARLERKVAAGAQYVMTQPVFDIAQVPAMQARVKHLGVPVFTGVWPLLNGRQAEFLHNEVPGIVIPDRVREKMTGKEGAEGRGMGVELAKEICRAALDCFPGVYLITPFLNFDTTVELAQFVRQR